MAYKEDKKTNKKQKCYAYSYFGYREIWAMSREEADILAESLPNNFTIECDGEVTGT